VAVGEIDVGKLDGAVADVGSVSSVTEPVSTAAVMVGASLLPWIVMVTV